MHITKARHQVKFLHALNFHQAERIMEAIELYKEERLKDQEHEAIQTATDKTVCFTSLVFVCRNFSS